MPATTKGHPMPTTTTIPATLIAEPDPRSEQPLPAGLQHDGSTCHRCHRGVGAVLATDTNGHDYTTWVTVWSSVDGFACDDCHTASLTACMDMQ
jgi:hypothetical protein